MKNKFTKIITIVIASVLSFGFLSLAPTTVYAADDICSSDAAYTVKKAAGCYGNGDQLRGVIIGIINAVIAVSSIVAVIFVLIGGFNYMTSAGDSGKLEKGRKTVIYAAIGLVICALSFAIVNWTIGALDGPSDDSNNSQDVNQGGDEDDPTPITT